MKRNYLTPKPDWQRAQQGSEQWQRIEQLGATLNEKLNCPVRYPAFEKGMFECRCGVTFPVFAVEGAAQLDNWTAILGRHQNQGTS